ncbi:MAG: alpha/beta hydrolase family protein, partial [Gammaproteobacteria bacterium]|nr:alpha/beta hydrolase family protein [Gammaproteobacteria bacterium]
AIQSEVVPEQLQREQQLATQIRQGAAKWLNDGSAEFLSLYCASLIETKGSLLWLTAPNQTLLTPGVVRQACDYFPNIGWQTLTISPVGLDFSLPQMVADQATAASEDSSATSSQSKLVLAERTAWYEAQEKSNHEFLMKRLVPAEKELLAANKGYVLVAISASASIALEAINKQQLSPVAVVVLNISHPKDPQQKQIIEQLNELSMPVLDIYHVNARDLAEKRNRTIRGSNYRQILIPAMRDDFLGVETQVMRRIEDWLGGL